MESGVWCQISTEAKELVKRMLHVDPTRRPTAANILKHQWIVNRHRLPRNLLPAITKDPVTVKVHLIFKKIIFFLKSSLNEFIEIFFRTLWQQLIKLLMQILECLTSDRW